MLAITLSVLMGLDKLQPDTVLFALLIFIGVGLVLHSYGRTSAQRHAAPPK